MLVALDDEHGGRRGSLLARASPSSSAPLALAPFSSTIEEIVTVVAGVGDAANAPFLPPRPPASS